MQLDSEYSEKLMKPLENVISLKPSEYVNALNDLGIEISTERKVEEKFLRHFEHLIPLGKINNTHNSSAVKDFGFYIGTDKTIGLVESCRIMSNPKKEEPQPVNNVTVNVGGNFNGPLQTGTTNTAEYVQAAEPSKSTNFINRAAAWIGEHIIATTITAVITGLILAGVFGVSA